MVLYPVATWDLRQRTTLVPALVCWRSHALR